MYLSTDPCSLASMSNQLFLKQFIWTVTTYVYFICFKLDIFFWQSQNSTSAVYMTELEKPENDWIAERQCFTAQSS